MNLVLNIPHATPCTDFSKWSNPDLAKAEHDKWTDWFTDTLYRDQKEDGAVMVKSSYSRYDIDMERLVVDPMEDSGQGIVYTKTKDGRSTRELSPMEVSRRYMEYHKYHMSLAEACRFPNTILLDCHSYPTDFSESANTHGKVADVCIGFNETVARPGINAVDIIERECEDYGLSVGINQPFSNAVIGTPCAHSIMVDIRKGVYMNEDTLELQPWAYKVNMLLNRIYRKLEAL